MHFQNIIFLLVLVLSFSVFIYNLRNIISNIKRGKDIDRSDNKKIRLKNMFRVAMGQSKMFNRPIAAVLHLCLYVGFIIINIEVLCNDFLLCVLSLKPNCNNPFFDFLSNSL